MNIFSVNINPLKKGRGIPQGSLPQITRLQNWHPLKRKARRKMPVADPVLKNEAVARWQQPH
jgi:hypothetical protein